MAENSGIEWTHHTFNPWWGCTKVSPGCDHCYAERDAARFAPTMKLWGEDGSRRTFGEKHWRQPLLWNERAQRAGVRQRVFCASMADVFDKDAPGDERARLWRLIKATPHLDWLILTKRIGNAARMLPADWPQTDGVPLAGYYPNVWLGISVVNQEEADRDIPKLLKIPAAVRFLSCEPLLGPMSIYPYLYTPDAQNIAKPGTSHLHWVIVGGESGHKARPMDEEDAWRIRKQCAHAKVAFFFKQGSQANWPRFKDFESFPQELQVREFPR